MSDRSYINADGFVVFTSKHLRIKNSCCKSNCLHCPYGATLKNIGVKVESPSLYESAEIKRIKSELFPTDNYSSSLLAEAFGSGPSLEEKDLRVLSLKSVICGMAYITNNKIIKLSLLNHFSDQGITESYLQSILE